MDRVIIFDATLRDGEQAGNGPVDAVLKVDFDRALVFGKGSSTDVIEASTRACISALNRLVHPAPGRKVQETGS